MRDLKIECPKCGWEPDGGAYWMCSQCQYMWNTFDTAAQCPQCHFQHEHTSCIPSKGGCHAYEPHLDWYKNLSDIVQEELDTILIEKEVTLKKTAALQNTTTAHSPCADVETSPPESAGKPPLPAS